MVVVTAQHRRMLDQVLEEFDIEPDVDLDIMRPRQTLTAVTNRALAMLERPLRRFRPDVVLVQGDTTSAFASALAAHYRRIAVGHVEAGLRTNDKYAPYPEEMNRRLISRLADLHFAPTAWARDNLLAEGVSRGDIHVTGNTVIDALMMTLKRDSGPRPSVLRQVPRDGRLVLVTAHRRESFGPGLARICRALARLSRRNSDVHIVYPVHPNPNVRKPARDILGGIERVHLIRPPAYSAFVCLLRASSLVLTDSGGIQEEAPALGKPVLVLREKTERPEALEAGTARLVGTNSHRIVEETEQLLGSRRAYNRMARAVNPFGDGRAAPRIARALLGTVRQD